MNDNVDFKTFLNNSVSQSIVLELPQLIEIFKIINSSNIKKAVACDNILLFLRMGGEIFAPVLPLYCGHAFELGLHPKIFQNR